MIVFSAKLEIAHNDGDLGTSDDEDDEDHEKETKEIVKLVKPNRRHYEEKLNENGTERQNSSHQDGHDWVHVPNLVRDLSWDLVCADRNFHLLFLESEITSDEDERHGNSEPQCGDCQQSSKVDSSA